MLRDHSVKVVLLAAVGFAVIWVFLAINRHAAFETNAFDLGYITQTLWYTAHGQPFRFTTLEGVPFSPEGTLDPSLLHRPHSLLAFHVEPLLLAVAPVFALWPDPRLLLALQAVALAAGAIPAAALARLRTGSPVAGALFGLVFLVSPSIAAAALSDFHAVTLGATFLLAALYFFAAGQRRRTLLFAALAAASREDAAIAVVALGAYLGLRCLRRRWVARKGGQAELRSDPLDTYPRESLYLLVGAGVWVILVFFAITPFFNGTVHALLNGGQGVGSIFWHRYEWLGASPLSAFRNVFLDPGRWIGWYRQADVLAYLLTLALSGGGIALVAPEALAIGLPIALQNSLSSFDWMRSGGAHYSTVLVPIVIFAGIEGTRRIARARWHPGGIAGIALVAALANNGWLGASPLVPAVTWPTPDARDVLVQSVLDGIPAAASVSASSAVYPHLASRAQAYWFPALQDATYVAIDAASSTDPVLPSEVQQRVTELIGSGDYGVDAVAPGLLVLRRGGRDPEIPADFYAFAWASDGELRRATKMRTERFGAHLLLDAYRVGFEPTLAIFGPAATVTTYWHVDAAAPDPTSFVFYVSRRSDGAMVGQLPDRAPEAVWYPTSRWPPGQTIKLTVRLERARALEAIGVAVLDPSTGQRLPLQLPPSAPSWENGTIARITRLDGG